ncbi:PP2C family protein-serine/threonine phosphatase [Streptomyces sp. CBMA29]|uniref:PP2C family protein-serine/threonine phosphatase n=1 Tax=Streptomyces sp. CBMA29 TaxID=1896314 RepID=UPI002948B990|nr:PP2C family protein-serine/threonine phosphatase [Streptomyces sp. CBMA29]MBD0734820.1 phosphatase [Streptomyces sp. CBMA29]
MTNFLAVERALRAAAPYALLDTARTALAEHYGTVAADLLLADYSTTVLQSVDTSAPSRLSLPVHNTPQGRAFGSQQPVEQRSGRDGEVTVHLPVTVRGDRQGILTVVLPADRHAVQGVGELAEVAELLGRELVVAERDTDHYLVARRAARLTLAAEMQWELLPGRAFARPEYSLGAQLEPAYAIHGDNFDWSASPDTLSLAITNGMGAGIDASLLTSLAVNALRNARRAGIGIADQAALADQALWSRYRGAAHVATLLLSFDVPSGVVQVVDAGSPRLWRQRGKTVERVEFDEQLPLGMFEETLYVVEEFHVLPGDRLLFASDGVYATYSPEGDAYGDRALIRGLSATSLLPAADVPGAVLRELPDYRGHDADDDALVVCLDWFGPQEESGA